ncbi:MAG: hypothetical protein J07HQW1_02947 [Haloquadratum walsbyi J07HQW1]|uniref:Uncharacterized protein n=1 Tax=Haloquadratum walsbyi J07HQW1 TaxID=1238424 RepID=U1N8R2_9EURY|nr:MAG: hypothetical protein J07HQW1_02947 [Haloquadratum walsbyi J07HQW1]
MESWIANNQTRAEVNGALLSIYQSSLVTATLSRSSADKSVSVKLASISNYNLLLSVVTELILFEVYSAFAFPLASYTPTTISDAVTPLRSN